MLTNTEVRQAKPQIKDYWMSDEKGLRLLIKNSGAKYWRFKYRFDGKQKTLALGVYPEITLKDARLKRDEARLQIARQTDPGKIRQEAHRLAHGDPFADLALEWWEHQKGTWTEDHAARVWKRMKDNALVEIGTRSVTKIEPMDVISMVEKIEQRGALDVAGRVLNDVRRVFRFGVQRKRLTINPASELDASILKAKKVEHRPSLPREELPQFLRALALYGQRGRLLTQLAVQLLVLTFVRSGELRGARWDEFDLEAKIWRIPAERMKMKSEHLVPLSSQAIAILEQIKPITEQYDLLFPSEKDRQVAMSDNTMRFAIFRMGYDGKTPGKSKCVPHGFRATATSILNEAGFNADAIERQLSHTERNSVRAAYIHHAQYLEERTNFMQWWADYLDELKASDSVIPLFAKKN